MALFILHTLCRTWVARLIGLTGYVSESVFRSKARVHENEGHHQEEGCKATAAAAVVAILYSSSASAVKDAKVRDLLVICSLNKVALTRIDSIRSN